MSRNGSRRAKPPKKPLTARLLRIAGWALAAWLGLTVLLVLPLRWIDPPLSSFMARAAWQGHDLQHRWADWASISPAVPIAVVAAEDQRFPMHGGFDLHSIRSALFEESGRKRGASTISQQVAKNLWLWPGRSWLRKGLEAWFTVWMEILWPKRRILEVYLNIAEFGPGVFGVESAARRFFGKPASAVREDEAALLAAVLPAPRRMSPASPSQHVQRRARWIRDQVRGLGGPGYLENL